MPNRDAYGMALKAYAGGDTEATIAAISDIAETEEWPLSEFFHTWETMGELERRALTMAQGRTLDVGAGSGSHALWLQERGADVTAIDISPLAVEVMRERGLRHAKLANFYDLPADERYDTIIMLMNGAGIAGTADNLDIFMNKVRDLLADGGQALIDSSDIIYLYEEEDGSAVIPMDRYYGDLEYAFEFRGTSSETFPWVFVDQQTLADAATRCGLKAELVAEGEHYDFLMRFTKA